MRHKLSNVVLDPAGFMDAHMDVFYREDDAGAAVGEAGYDAEELALGFSGEVCFLTYFNSCSWGKWRKYAGISSLGLHLEISGDPCEVRLLGLTDGDESATELQAWGSLDAKARGVAQDRVGQDRVGTSPTPAAGRCVGTSPTPAASATGDASTPAASATGDGAGTRRSFDIEFPQTDKDIVGFSLATVGKAFLHEAYYFTDVPESSINPVRLALCTTTFKKEEYIVPNIELVKREILGCDDGIAGNFHMFVIDNGRSLDCDALSGPGVTVRHNKNTGGAGGFARGMMEALASPAGYTHVLLMDDDVRICSESLKRTYNLLSLAKGEYAGAFVNGAMLAMEKPEVQHEDVGYVHDSGAYYRVKKHLRVSDVRDAARNEAIDVNVDRAYGAWWYCCMPVEVIRAYGLPLPVFVRCDDVEYGMRVRPKFMTMNGICVWHEAFAGRFRPAVDCYQFVRNFAIMIAMDDCAPERLFIARANRNVRLYLRYMNYVAAELTVEGFEDYMKGPEFLASANGEELMRANGARSEKLDELDPDLVAQLKYKPKMMDPYSQSKLLKLFRSLPYDRHYLPDAMLREKNAPIFYSGITTMAANTIGSSTLVALDPSGTRGTVRRMDRKRWRDIRDRWKRAKADHAARGDQVRQAYKDAKAWLTSWDFWNEYLGTDLHPYERPS